MRRECLQVRVQDALLLAARLVVAVAVRGRRWVKVLREPQLSFRLQVMQPSEHQDAVLVQQVFNLLEVFIACLAGMKTFDESPELGDLAASEGGWSRKRRDLEARHGEMR